MSIRESYPALYMKRKKLERSTNVFTMPLPWRPGWRNLVSGRPLGGNPFARGSFAEMLRTFVQQLPYYIPPVVIANLINLLFFIFLLGAVEVVPFIVGVIFTGPLQGAGISSPFNKVRPVDPMADPNNNLLGQQLPTTTATTDNLMVLFTSKRVLNDKLQPSSSDFFLLLPAAEQRCYGGDAQPL
jgi:hypothetical protein